MLVISRKVDETVHIGENVKVTVVAVVGGKVRLGIEAPKEVNVLRGELVGKEADRSVSGPSAPGSPG